LTSHPIDTSAELRRRIVVNGIVLAIRELKHEQIISTTISKRVYMTSSTYLFHALSFCSNH
jgi:hypothetical protein